MSLPTPLNHQPNILRFNARCPVCQGAYDFQKIRILGEREQQLLAYLDCPVCGTALLSILSFNPGGLSAQGVITDLTVEEVVDEADWNPISSDEVLDLHRLLEQHEAAVFTSHSSN